MQVSENFGKALQDYVYLIDREYPARGALTLVSDRYGLNGRERSMLYRGIFAPRKAAARKSKIIANLKETSGPLLIDGFNVLVIVASYLQGLPVFLSNDGFVRDAAKGRGDTGASPRLPEAAGLLGDFLEKESRLNPVVYLDQQVPQHPVVAGRFYDIQAVEIRISEKVDRDLISHTHGVICTSDSGIIHRSPLPVFDLAREILEHNFALKIMDLQNLMMK
ncbi:MAG: DUF434 domain-containing protein [Bacteroidales bacterium]